MTSSFYSVMPGVIRHHPKLSDKAKLFFSEIAALIQMGGTCTATNKYFADVYHITVRSVQHILAELQQEGFITTEILYDTSGAISGRSISLTTLGFDHTILGRTASPTPDAKNSTSPSGKNCTSYHIVNTLENNKYSYVSDDENGRNTSSPKLEFEDEAKEFCAWFKNTLPANMAEKINDDDIASWSDAYDKLRRIDKLSREEIYHICTWARNDKFWSTNFFTPVKLRKKPKNADKDDNTKYWKIFMMKSSAVVTPNPRGEGFKWGPAL